MICIFIKWIKTFNYYHVTFFAHVNLPSPHWEMSSWRTKDMFFVRTAAVNLWNFVLHQFLQEVWKMQWPTMNAQDVQAKSSSVNKTDKEYGIWDIFTSKLRVFPGFLLESFGHGHCFLFAIRRISGAIVFYVNKVKIVYTFPSSAFFYTTPMMWMNFFLN